MKKDGVGESGREVRGWQREERRGKGEERRRSQPDSGGTDTTIRSDQPDTNYATTATLKVGTLGGYAGHGLLQFDLSSIPQSAVVTGGTLSLWVAVDNATASGTLCVYRVKQNWTESGATWNSYDGTNPWNTAGAYSVDDVEQTSVGCANTTASQAVDSRIDITLSAPEIQEMLVGLWTNRGFSPALHRTHTCPGGRCQGCGASVLRYVQEGDTNRYEFYSSDEATKTTERPKLVVNYTVGMTPTGTPTATPLPTNTPDWVTGAYTYDTGHPHAVSTVTYTDTHNGNVANHYTYDDNGNMTGRVVGNVTWTLTYNAENRLATMSSASVAATMIYDADGNKVAQINNGVTTYYFMGGMYEVTGTSLKKYYAIAGAMVAMRDASGLQYFLTDHLGSVVGITDDTGTLTSQQRFLPFGGLRTDVGSIAQTDFGYTGQRALSALTIYDYRARAYDPMLIRFLQPDILVPGAANPQNWNRYSYVRNSPIIHNDPSGHYGFTMPTGTQCGPDGIYCEGGKYSKPSYVDTSKLTQVDGTHSHSGWQLYQKYIDAWFHPDGWWWRKLGGDGKFTITEFLGILWGYELGGIGGGKGKDADLLQHSVDAMSVNIGGRSAYGASISIEGQLNFLADWSSSARNRIDLNLQLDYLDPKRIGYGIQVSQTLYPSSHVLYDRPYEVVIDSNEMNYAVDLGTMIKNGYYWDKASDNKFAVLTYCQTQYMSTGEILKGCDMTAHAP
jgi:RHS repeat-associated protein